MKKLFRQNAEFLIVRAGGTYTYHSTLNDSYYCFRWHVMRTGFWVLRRRSLGRPKRRWNIINRLVVLKWDNLDSWLRHWATSPNVVGLIPGGIIWILHRLIHHCSTMILGYTQSLKEISATDISWRVKAAGAYGWQPSHLHVPAV